MVLWERTTCGLYDKERGTSLGPDECVSDRAEVDDKQ